MPPTVSSAYSVQFVNVQSLPMGEVSSRMLTFMNQDLLKQFQAVYQDLFTEV